MVVVAVAAWCRLAAAGNGSSLFVGHEAALVGGAVVATVRDGSAVYYNPAGLASIDDDTLDLSASAYALRFGGNVELKADAADGNATERRLSRLDLNLVPVGLAYARRLGAWRGAFGVFAPAQTSSYPRSYVATARGAETRQGVLAGNDIFFEYNGGLAFARTVAPGLRLGAGLLVLYSSRSQAFGLGTDAALDGETTTFAQFFGVTDQILVGAQAIWGLQVDIAAPVHLGLTFRSPVFQLYELAQTLVVYGEASAPSPALRQAVVVDEFFGLKSQTLKPMRLDGGVAVDLGRARLSADATVQAPYADPTGLASLSGQWNVRLGARMPVFKDWVGGAGVFTDRSAIDAKRSPTAPSFDFYGAIAGVQMATRYRLAPSATRDAPRALTFTTTVAFSYAYGAGRLGNVVLGGLDQPDLATRTTTTDAHQLVLHFGSTFAL